MMIRVIRPTQLIAGLCLVLAILGTGQAADLVTLANVVDSGQITSDEPMADTFSAEEAARYLDTAALHWQKSRKCAACHVNLGYMFARPALGLALIVARELGVPSSELRRGIDWLLQNQRVSGKWFARSPAKNSRHYFSNSASAFAVLGLQACGELPGWPLSNATGR
jgi:hypothetical protein